MTKILGFLIAVILGIPLTLLGGVVLSDIWGWFIAPTFDVVTITTWQAVGVMLFASFLKLGLRGIELKDEDHQPIVALIAKQFGFAVGYLFLWGLASIWNIFI